MLRMARSRNVHYHQLPGEATALPSPRRPDGRVWPGISRFYHYRIERERELLHVREDRPVDERRGSLAVVAWVVVAFGRQRIVRLLASLLMAALPLACAVPRPATSRGGNPFLGTWVAAEHASITFRPDTVLQNSLRGVPQAFDHDTCGGVFRFRYASESREDLPALIPRQPVLRDQLSRLLPQSRYRVAELVCDRGDQTYVLLNENELLAIYRDGDIGGIEHLARRGS